MIQQTVCFSLIALFAGPLATITYGQGGGLLNKAAANAQARAEQRAQADAQQRVQTRIQQRTQAQVQQRVQAQLQQRLQSQQGNRIRGAVQSAKGTARRMQKRGPEARLQGGAKASARTGGNLPATRFSADTKVRVNGSGRLVVPGPALRGNGEVNVQYFDHVFGRFNPFRTAPAEEGAATTASGVTSTVRAQSAAETAPTLSSNPEATPEAEPSDPARPSRTRAAGKGFAVVEGRVDLNKAVRLRRSEISAIRDYALETGNAQLLASADRLEGILDRFLAAQATAETQARGTIAGSASATGQANASAMGQARGQFGPAGTRVAELPPTTAPTPETEQPAGSDAPQPAPTEPAVEPTAGE